MSQMRCNSKSIIIPALWLFIAFIAQPGQLAMAGARASSPDISWPVQLRQQMLRITDIEWRLRRAAGPNCKAMGAATGLMLDYIGAYQPRDWPLVRRELGLSGHPQVAAVAAGSPAEKAGIKPGDDLTAINGVGIDAIFAGSSDRLLLADELADMMTRNPAGEPIILELKRGNAVLTKRVDPLRLCAGRVILKIDRKIEAYSDERDIGITTAMVAFTQNDDELALIAAHELAHVLLRHERHSGGANRRKMEKQADLTGAALAHCAGFDILKAIAFWPRYESQDRWRWIRSPTHGSPGQRERQIRGAVKDLSCPVSFNQPRAP